MSRLVKILKASPATYVINKNCLELSILRNNVFQQTGECLPCSEIDAAAPFVCISSNYGIAILGRILLDGGPLNGN